MPDSMQTSEMQADASTPSPHDGNPISMKRNASIFADAKITTPPPTPAPPRAAKMPTEDEWTSHCREVYPDWPENRIRLAHASYEAKGWVIGKAKVKSWKHCARTCYLNAKEWGHIPAPTSNTSRAGYNSPALITGNEDPFA